jgi:hypothetical protein
MRGMNRKPISGEPERAPVRTSALATAAAAVGGLILALGSVEVSADEAVCGLVTIEAPLIQSPAWQSAVEDLRIALHHELTGLECAPIALFVEPAQADSVMVRARSADGRETRRPVPDPRALVPIVLGLLASAPAEPPSKTTPAARSPSRPPRAEADPHDVPDFAPPSPSKVTSPSPVNVSLGISTGVRVGVPTDVAMWDSEVRADVLFHDWLVMALIRYAPLAAVSGLAPDTDAYGELGFGFGAGRHWRWDRQTLELTLAPSIVLVALEIDSPKERSGELAQLRVTAAARYGYGLGRGWRFTVTLDTEVAPSSLIQARYANPALPPIPAWTAGLRLGAAASLL